MLTSLILTLACCLNHLTLLTEVCSINSVHLTFMIFDVDCPTSMNDLRNDPGKWLRAIDVYQLGLLFLDICDPVHKMHFEDIYRNAWMSHVRKLPHYNDTLWSTSCKKFKSRYASWEKRYEYIFSSLVYIDDYFKWHNVLSTFQTLIKDMLHWNPAERLTCEQLLKKHFAG